MTNLEQAARRAERLHDLCLDRAKDARCRGHVADAHYWEREAHEYAWCAAVLRGEVRGAA